VLACPATLSTRAPSGPEALDCQMGAIGPYQPANPPCQSGRTRIGCLLASADLRHRLSPRLDRRAPDGRSTVIGIATFRSISDATVGVHRTYTASMPMPIPDKVVSASGRALLTGDDIARSRELQQGRGAEGRTPDRNRSPRRGQAFQTAPVLGYRGASKRLL
jgi:hypothetical protein